MCSVLRQKNVGLILCLWVASLAACILTAKSHGYGWDLWVYTRAVHSIKIGHDPYQDALAAQTLPKIAPNTPNLKTYMIYLYPPITLPMLRIIAHLHARLAHAAYWLLYLLCACLPPIVAVQFTTPQERTVFSLLAPFSLYLNGVLFWNVIYSGNIAYILYGLVFLAAWFGWRHDRWLLFYLAVFFAGCMKPPMLSLLVLSVFSARRQWLPAILTGAAGISAFLLSRVLWPAAFSNYLQIMRFRFAPGHDFGFSPTSLITNLLNAPGHASSVPGWIFYLAFSIILLAVLFPLRRRFLNGQLTTAQYIPILAIAAILFNPRIMEYDTTAISLFLVILLWRILHALTRSRNVAACVCAAFFLLQFAFRSYMVPPPTQGSSDIWRATTAIAILIIWAVACMQIFKSKTKSDAQPALSEMPA